MKAEFAIITTNGESGEYPFPVPAAKVEEVASGVGHFTCAEDTKIAEWMMMVSKILTLR